MSTGDPAVDFGDVSYVPSLEQMLAEVNRAIFYTTRNQSYSIADRTYTRADLKELRDWRRQLQDEVDAASTNPNRRRTNYAQLERPS